jgi:chromate transporter
VSHADLLELFARFLLMSLLAIGGGITVVPEMHRLMVGQHGWLTDAQFAASISLAQASPGPNILLVTVMGWNAGGWAGAAAATLGILLPSTTVALLADRGAQRWRDHRLVRAFREGTLPITLGLLLAAGWVLAAPTAQRPAGWILTAATALLVWRTRIHPLWLIGAGALAGGLGLLQ